MATMLWSYPDIIDCTFFQCVTFTTGKEDWLNKPHRITCRVSANNPPLRLVVICWPCSMKHLTRSRFSPQMFDHAPVVH